MASIRARTDGRLFFDFRYQNVRCRELTALEDSAANRRKMEKAMTRIETEIADGTFDYARTFPGSKLAARFDTRTSDPRPAPTLANALRAESTLPFFADFAAAWKQEKQIEWRLSYRAAMDSILSTHLLPAFADKRLNEIGRPEVLKFRSELPDKRNSAPPHKNAVGKGLAPSTMNRIVGVLRMIMEEATLRYGTANPCIGVKRLKLQRKDIEPFSLTEVRTILGRVRNDYRPYLCFRFFTGVRSGEAHGLKWKHVDFEHREIRIRETYQDGRTEYTKTDGSQREIHMSQPVFDALMSMRPKAYLEDSKSCDDRYVFCTRNGNPIDNTNFNDRVWKPLLRNLEFEYRRPYEMRHTCATLWLAAGESPEWIARQLGHTTTEMLFRTYSRYVPHLVRHDGSAFDTLVSAVLNGGVKAANGEPDPLLKVAAKRRGG